jgi:class 3 adenylate cyclase/tetratricopeptide (TPR) repeat protein
MKCPRCKRENDVGAKFCEECAAPLRTCTNCGRQLSQAAKFCPECAHPTGSKTTKPMGQCLHSPEAYTPKHLAEKILTSKAALEGERKQVTVLFADLKGSMELLADRDPEEARKILDPVLERMMDAVHQYEGTVNQVMGDGIMALFGAPIAHEDHAVRACYAALRMQESVKVYAEEVRRSHGTVLKIREGLNSGDVVVRLIGSDLRMDYTAVGQTTHMAARMEQLATPGMVLLTANTLRLAEGYVTVEPKGLVPVKGLDAPIEVYDLAGVGPRASRFHGGAPGPLTRFVGREMELEELRHAMGRIPGGHGHVVAIVGEPGVGKSRLIWEITDSPRAHGWLVLRAGSVSYRTATSYLLIIDLLKRYFAIDDRDGLVVAREKMLSKLSSLDHRPEADLPALLSLLDLPTDDPAWLGLDPIQRRRRTVDGVIQLLARASQVQPLLIVLEDLHWIDLESQALLDALVDRLPAFRLLLIVDYRPEYTHVWGRHAWYTELRLSPLPPDGAEALLGSLLGPDPGLDPVRHVLVARTGGNPFYLEESVRDLVESGTLVGVAGAYRMARPLPARKVPPTVQAVLAARIDRLSAQDKEILETASVVGIDVPLVLLQAVAGLAEDELNAAIGRLQAANFLNETGLLPNREYTFKHALTHDVTYDSLLQDRRRTLHGRIVDIIEHLHADRLVEQVERLAHHAVRGEVWDKATRYLRQAAEKAAARSANWAAVRYYEEALEALAHLPQIRETTAQAIDLRFALRNGLFAVGEHARIRACVEEARRLAQAGGDEGRLAWASVYMSNYFWREGDPARAVDLGQHALDVADERRDSALRITASLRLGQAYHAQGDYRRAVECLAGAVVMLPNELNRALFGLAGLPSVFCRAFLVWSLAELGEFREGIRYGEEAIEIADTTNQLYSRAMARFTLGFLYLVQGEPVRAVNLLEPGLAIQESGELLALRVMFLAALGHARTLADRPLEALTLLEQSVEASAFAQSPQHPFPLLFHAEACLRAGQIKRGVEAASHALQFSHARREAGSEAWAHRLLAEAGLRHCPPNGPLVEEHCRRAMGLAAERGMRPLLAHCHLGLAELKRHSGTWDDARAHLATAASMYRELEMRSWFDKAERALTAA